MRKVLSCVCLLVLFAVPAKAQESAGVQMLQAIQQTLGNHLGVGVSATYDWVAQGDNHAPYAVGPVAAWKVNDQLMLTGGSRYVLNARKWRSEVNVTIPLYGSKFLGGSDPVK